VTKELIICSYVRKLLYVKGTGPCVLGKVAVNIVKREECTRSFGSGTAFYSMAEGDKDMSDVNVKRRLHKISKINVAHYKVSILEGVFGGDLMTTENDVTFCANVNDIGGHPFYVCEVCERKL